MSDLVKAALILGAAILLAAALVTYFLPFNSCVRTFGGSDITRGDYFRCAAMTSGGVGMR